MITGHLDIEHLFLGLLGLAFLLVADRQGWL